VSILKHQLRQPVILLSIAVIAVIAIGGIFHAPINRQMHRWKLLPEPERLTELYFTNPNKLPKTYTPGQPQEVSFTVHNLEYRSMNYRYQITQSSQDGQQSQVMNTGAFSLGHDLYHTAAVNIPTVNLGDNVKVEVKLINTNESIDYLLKKEGA